MEKQIKIIVDYWVNFLDGKGSIDNADLGATNDMLVAFLRSAGRSNKLSTQQVEVFRNELASKLTQEAQLSRFITLEVDYSPCKILREVIAKASIPDSFLPIKTFTEWDIKKGEISARNGYSAPIETLWQAE